jgi:hypothetical protein
VCDDMLVVNLSIARRKLIDANWFDVLCCRRKNSCSSFRDHLLLEKKRTSRDVNSKDSLVTKVDEAKRTRTSREREKYSRHSTTARAFDELDENIREYCSLSRKCFINRLSILFDFFKSTSSSVQLNVILMKTFTMSIFVFSSVFASTSSSILALLRRKKSASTFRIVLSRKSTTIRTRSRSSRRRKKKRKRKKRKKKKKRRRKMTMFSFNK